MINPKPSLRRPSQVSSEFRSRDDRDVANLFQLEDFAICCHQVVGFGPDGRFDNRIILFVVQYVPIRETVRGFKEILEGKHDDVPEQAFYMVGGIDDVIEKAKTL